MRAVLVKQHGKWSHHGHDGNTSLSIPGDASQLYIGDYPTPTPNDKQILVKVEDEVNT